MANRLVKFKSAGGPVTLEVVSAFAQGGAYTYHLWNKDELAEVKTESGQFKDNPPKRHSLAGTNDENDQRFVDVDCTVVIIPPIKNFMVTVNVFQDGKKIDSVSSPEGGPGTSSSPDEDVDVYFQLIKY